MILEIFLPIPVNKSFFYKLDGNESIKIGNLVNVNFRNKYLVGLVWNIIPEANINKTIKPVIRVYQDIRFNDEILNSISFIAKYTCNSISSILKLFLSGFSDKDFDKKNNKSLSILDLNERFITKALLNEDQKNVLHKIENNNPGKFNVVLLDGVTGSGKTRVYMHALLKNLKLGFQSVVLVPEKVLTKQWINELSTDFGISPEIYHSSVSLKNRSRIWHGINRNDVKIVIGTRSALFLPFKKLGLIVVDEEHDSSFKQEEGVIVNARDLAIVRARNSNSQIILSSATPSIETLLNCKKRKYQRVRLSKRVGKSELPILNVIDMKEEVKEKNRWISKKLIKQIKLTLGEKKQTLIFLNKRGYAPAIVCKKCGHSKICKNCDFTLALHKNSNHKNKTNLLCHYCNYRETFINKCDKCNNSECFIAVGPGIERIYEEVKNTFPNSKICLLSSDIIKNQNDWDKIVSPIMKNEVDIIIGTQIISKGHHFPHLKTVGILNIDNLLNSFDLRASEKAYQLITQVSGRAGREEMRGKVFIQTFQPNHPVIRSIITSKKENFIDWELSERKKNLQPPYSKLISLIIMNKEKTLAEDHSFKIIKKLRQDFSEIVCFGPSPAPLFKIRNNFRWRILIKYKINYLNQKKLKKYLINLKDIQSINLKIDVDPISFF